VTTRVLAPAARAAQWALFLGLVAVYAVTIDKRDLLHYELHHTASEVISEHHRFWHRVQVEGHWVGADRFDFEGKVYPNKQPGSLLAGALAYTLLRPFGFSYLTSYFLTAALVSLVTSAACTAAAAVLVYRKALEWSGGARWALASAAAYGLGSIAWPYSGTLHHDAMAAAFLFAAFYFLERRAFWCGLFLGLALTTSLLVSATALVLAVAFFWLRERDARGPFVAGAVLGLLPLLVYNALSFGNPFGQAVFVADHAQHLEARFDLSTYAALAWTYLRLLAGFTPITLLGIAGAWLLPAARRRERNLLGALLGAHLAFVLAVNATGACQYGPRMLLPVLPFAALGLVGFAATRPRTLAMAAVLAVLLLSVAFNLLGALYGTHFCPPDRWAVASYFDALRGGTRFSLPLLEALGAPRGPASIEMDRERALYLAQEARVATMGGDFAEAHRRLDAAAALAPDVALVHHFAANLAYLEGDLASAEAALERALLIEPEDALLRENLARLRARLESRERAAGVR
jgi:hypothetical protein